MGLVAMERASASASASGWRPWIPAGVEVADEGGGGVGDGGEVLVREDELLVRWEPGRRGAGAALAGEWGGVWRPLVRRRGPVLAGVRGSVWEDLGVWKVPAGMVLEEAMARVARRPGVVYVEPNLRLELAVLPRVDPPNDFEFIRQWALDNQGQTGGVPGADIGALEAWGWTTGSTNVVVAIIDTGVDFFHPDLEANLWRNPGEIAGNGVDDDGNGYVDDLYGYDWVSDDADPMDDNLHGTHVAGILGAVGNDENGVAGVAWSVRLMALKAFDERGSGTLDHTLASVAYAVENGADILNASWGTTTRSRALDEVVAEAVQRGVVVVAAAGNNGSEAPFYPAAVPEALAVGATDAKDGSPAFSNYGRFVDLVAPGEAIQSTAPNAHWTLLSGTSMAAPHVSGVAALLLSKLPGLTPEQVGTLLRSSADRLPTERFTGAGRLNAARALAYSGPLPQAKLDMLGEVSGIWDVRGTAAGPSYAGHRLELGQGRHPEVWQFLQGSATPVVDGKVLGAWDTGTHDDGEYTLRLSVTNTLGELAWDEIRVTIRNVRLLDPQNNDVRRPGDSWEIQGTVGGEGRTFTLEWGQGHAPVEWRTEGMRLAQEGRSPVVQGTVGWWDSRVAPTNSFISLRLVARVGDRQVGEAYARMVHLEPRLRPGFPLALPFSADFPVRSWREFNVADLDGDGRQEIVLVDHGEAGGRAPRLMVWGVDGTLRWSRTLEAGDPELDAPVIGDITGDGRLEILVDTGASGAIAAFTAEGEPLGGHWPVSPGGNHHGKILADVTGDGRLELISWSVPPNDLIGERTRRLAVISGEGRVLRRWELPGCDEDDAVPEFLPVVARWGVGRELAVVVAEDCGTLSAWDVRQEKPLWRTSTPVRWAASPVAGDLDDDGLDEIVIGGVRRGPGQAGGVYVFQADGQIRPGWPVVEEASFSGAAALADLTGDGQLEIIIAGWEKEQVHVLDADGFPLPGWPTPLQTSASTRSIPVIGDVDGDGIPDVVLASSGSWLSLVLRGDDAQAGGIRAWRRDGVGIDFQPGLKADGLIMEASGGASWRRYPPAVLTDLDGDGWLDVVAATIQDRLYSPTPPITGSKMRSSLYAWELPVPWRSDTAPWGQFQGGASRSGRWVRPAVPPQPPRLRGLPHQTVAMGHAFRAVPLDRYVEDPDGSVDQLIWTVEGSGQLRLEIDEQRWLRVTVPGLDWEGAETWRLTVQDPEGGQDTGEVRLQVRRDYRPPVAGEDRAVTDEDRAVEFDVLANDHSPLGHGLQVLAVSHPENGRVEVSARGWLLYEPDPDWHGEDSMEYTVVDQDGGTASGLLRVEVRPVNDPPVARPDRMVLDEDTSGEVFPLVNDEDVDGDPVTLAWMGTPEFGTLEALGSGGFRFVPPQDYFGFQSFTYAIRDPSEALATGVVSVVVRPVNDPPRLRDQHLTLNRNQSVDVFYDAEDPDGDRLIFEVVEGPESGVLLAYPGIAHFTPAPGFVGQDRMRYSASDGILTVGPATVTFEVLHRNNPPEIRVAPAVTAVDQELHLPLMVRDVDGDPVSVWVVEGPDSGSVILEGTNAWYRPAPGFLGTDLFTVRASDGEDESEAFEVRIRVTDENTPPKAVSELLTVGRNRTSAVTLRATDAENNPLTFEVVRPPEFGRLEGEPPQLRYTPQMNFRGLDRFDFVAADRVTTSQVAVVQLLVRDPNTVPWVTNQTLRVERDEAREVLLAAHDVDGDALRAVVMKGPRWGRVHGQGLEYVYVPQPGFVGSDGFTYKVWDGRAYSGEATVTLMVERFEPVSVVMSGVVPTEAGLELRVEVRGAGTIRLEHSMDLFEWEVLGRASPIGGEVRWLDTAWRERAAGFYRAVVETADSG